MVATMMNSETNLAARLYQNATDLGLTALTPGVPQYSNIQTSKKKSTIFIMGISSGTVSLKLQTSAVNILDFAAPAMEIDFTAGAAQWGWQTNDPGSQDGNIIVPGTPYWGLKIDDGGAPITWTFLVVLELGLLNVEGGDNYHVVSAAWNALGKTEDGSIDPSLFL